MALGAGSRGARRDALGRRRSRTNAALRRQQWGQVHARHDKPRPYRSPTWVKGPRQEWRLCPPLCADVAGVKRAGYDGIFRAFQDCAAVSEDSHFVGRDAEA